MTALSRREVEAVEQSIRTNRAIERLVRAVESGRVQLIPAIRATGTAASWTIKIEPESRADIVESVLQL